MDDCSAQGLNLSFRNDDLDVIAVQNDDVDARIPIILYVAGVIRRRFRLAALQNESIRRRLTPLGGSAADGLLGGRRKDHDLLTLGGERDAINPLEEFARSRLLYSIRFSLVSIQNNSAQET